MSKNRMMGQLSDAYIEGKVGPRTLPKYHSNSSGTCLHEDEKQIYFIPAATTTFFLD